MPCTVASTKPPHYIKKLNKNLSNIEIHGIETVLIKQIDAYTNNVHSTTIFTQSEALNVLRDTLNQKEIIEKLKNNTINISKSIAILKKYKNCFYLISLISFF